jgi:hypothetical protein
MTSGIQARTLLRIPSATKSIHKGVPLKHLLGPEAVECLARNVSIAFSEFDAEAFRNAALDELEPLGVLECGQKLARALWQYVRLISVCKERNPKDQIRCR